MWVSKVKKSNLTVFVADKDIESPLDYFDSSKQGLKKLLRAKSEHEKNALLCIIEIGKKLSELQDYQKRVKSSKVDGLWNNLLQEVELSPATVTKYIKISNHPLLTDRRFLGRIPASVFSLYELTKLEPITLQLLIESNEINATSGRSVIASLSKPQSKSKKSSSKKVSLMTLSIPEKDWIKCYKNLEPQLLNTLDSMGLSYDFTTDVRSLENSEITRMKKIEKFVFQKSKVFFNQVVKSHIDQKCLEMHLCPPKTPFKKKMKLLKFGVDEVTTEGCIDTQEVSVRLIGLGLIEEEKWNQLQMEWMSQGFTKFPSRLPDVTEDTGLLDQTEAAKKNFTPVKMKRDFSDFKI